MSFFIDKHGRRKSPIALAACGAALLDLAVYFCTAALLAGPLYRTVSFGGETVTSMLHTIIITVISTLFCCLLFLLKDKRVVLVDDSIVRGTQLRETVEFLYESGAEEVHMRSACPPIMHSCKYLNFSRGNSDMDLLARRTIQELEGDEGQQHLEEYADVHTERGQCMLKAICEKLGFDSLGYQSLEGLLESIGLDRDKVCTYCWNGKE